MTTHSEQKFVPFTPDQLFEMVSDVQSYPKFLPWCVGPRIRSPHDEQKDADQINGKSRQSLPTVPLNFSEINGNSNRAQRVAKLFFWSNSNFVRQFYKN